MIPASKPIRFKECNLGAVHVYAVSDEKELTCIEIIPIVTQALRSIVRGR